MTPAVSERRFGLSVGGALGAFALVAAWRGHVGLAWGLGLAGGGLAAAALVAPCLLRPVERGWMAFAHVLAWFNTRVLLSLLFFLLLTPAGLVARAVGWDPLGDRRRRDQAGWVPYPARRRDPRHYEKMY